MVKGIKSFEEKKSQYYCKIERCFFKYTEKKRTYVRDIAKEL